MLLPLKVSLSRETWRGVVGHEHRDLPEAEGSYLCMPVLSQVKGAGVVSTEVVETVASITRGPFLTALATSGGLMSWGCT